MLILLKKRINDKSYNITNLLTSYTWSGSIERGTRSFSFEILNAPYDKELMDLIPVISTGDIVSLYTDSDYAVPNYLLFYGKVYSIGRKSDKGTVSYNCIDFLDNLVRSSTYRKFTSTAEDIARSLCGEFGMNVQYLSPTGVNIGTMVFEDKTYFDIINEAYEKAGLSTGKNYYMAMDGANFFTSIEGQTMVTTKLSDGSDVENTGKGNILSSSFEESMSELINRVNVYDSDGNFKTRIEDAESITKYGLFETNYTIEKDVDMATAAKKQLHDIDTTIVFDVLGEVNYISGRSVMVHDSATGLDGEFLITNDTHKWIKGTYISTLNLKFMEVTPSDQKVLNVRG